jgi:Holliday junction resolvasome RuvABC endonuclease subunit
MAPDPVPPVVMGLDLSLTATGIAHVDGSVETFKPKADPNANCGMDRMCEIRDYLLHVVGDVRDHELVMVEGLAFDAHDTSRWQAQLAGLIRATLFDYHVPFLLAPPSTVKKYATGNGKAKKEQVVNAAQKRLGYDGYDHNEADALWLHAIAHDLVMGEPVAYLPDAQRDALKHLRRQPPILRRTKR